MQKLLLLAILVLFSVFSYSQQIDTTHRFTNADYLAKSRNHKTGAWIMTGVGVAVLTGTLAYDMANLFNTESTNTTPYYVIGLGSVGTGIILFRSAAKNKRLSKANLTGQIKINRLQTPVSPVGISTSYPAISFQLHVL